MTEKGITEETFDDAKRKADQLDNAYKIMDMAWKGLRQAVDVIIRVFVALPSVLYLIGVLSPVVFGKHLATFGKLYLKMLELPSVEISIVEETAIHIP